MNKSNILFVVDKPDWAYEYMVKSWLPYLINDYNCYIIYQQDYIISESNKNNFFYRVLYNNFSKIKALLNKTDLKFIHKDGYFYTKKNNPLVYKYTDKEGNKNKVTRNINHFNMKIEMAFYFQYTSLIPFTADKNIVGIFTDVFPHDGPTFDIKRRNDRGQLSRIEFYNQYLSHYYHIFVGGGNLYADYKQISDKVSFVYGIYGEQNFIENKNVGGEKSLKIGWTGNPNRSMKGFHEFIEPVVEELIKEGKTIELKTKFSGSYEDLYTFYQDVDLVVIASSADSGPSLYAEACLSSVPVISTKVGLPLMGIKHNINGLFIERSKESLKEAILKVYEDRNLLKSFSQRVKKDYLLALGNDVSIKEVLNLLKK